MRGRVEELTSRYAGVAPNPHLFRDIVAFEWLKILNVTDDSATRVSQPEGAISISTSYRVFRQSGCTSFPRVSLAFFPLV